MLSRVDVVSIDCFDKGVSSKLMIEFGVAVLNNVTCNFSLKVARSVVVRVSVPVIAGVAAGGLVIILIVIIVIVLLVRRYQM